MTLISVMPPALMGLTMVDVEGAGPQNRKIDYPMILTQHSVRLRFFVIPHPSHLTLSRSQINLGQGGIRRSNLAIARLTQITNCRSGTVKLETWAQCQDNAHFQEPPDKALSHQTKAQPKSFVAPLACNCDLKPVQVHQQ